MRWEARTTDTVTGTVSQSDTIINEIYIYVNIPSPDWHHATEYQIIYFSHKSFLGLCFVWSLSIHFISCCLFIDIIVLFCLLCVYTMIQVNGHAKLYWVCTISRPSCFQISVNSHLNTIKFSSVVTNTFPHPLLCLQITRGLIFEADILFQFR